MNLLPHLSTGNVNQSTGQPDEVKTMFGTMPNFGDKNIRQDFNSPEQLKSLMNTVAGTGVSGEVPAVVADQVLPKVANAATDVKNYLQPDKTAEELVTNLGGGSKPTSEENIKELAKRINFSRNSNAIDALSHKTPVYEALGDKNISYKHPLYDIFEERDIKDYFDENSNTIKKWFSEKSPIGKSTDKFLENSTLNNSDDLQQLLGGRIGDIRKKSLREPLDKNEQEELADLQKVRGSLQSDQDQFIEKQSPYLANQNKLFRQKWRENVTPYDDHPILSEISRKGTTEGFTPSEVKGIFSYPTENVQKILQDIGTSGKNNVLYNEVQSAHPQDAKELASKILEAKQNGFQNYISPEMEALAKNLQKRAKASGTAKNVGKVVGGLAGGTVFGHPLVGLAGGAAWAAGKPALAKALEMMGKK